ncbi:MAG: phospholipid carrier-dependent glycosyltransferase [Anaerolineae bacterium]
MPIAWGKGNFRRYAGLIFLLVLYTILNLAYNYVIPFSKGPDEYIHYQYISFIAKHHRLPVTLAEKQEAGPRSDWQPLYYFTTGILAGYISLDPPPELKVTWQPATRQLIDLVLPRATLVRSEDERPPYRGVYAVWQMGRWVSLLLGAGTLILTYFIGLNLWPRQPLVATGATALLVFMPRFLFTHAVISDDTMVSFWLALYLLLLTKLIYRPERKPAWFWLGAIVGLSIISKFTAIPALAGALLSLTVMARKQRWGWGRLGQCYGLLVLGIFLTAGWWVGWVWWHFNQVGRLGLISGLIKPLLPGSAADDNPSAARLATLLSGQAVTSLGEAPGASGNYFNWLTNTFVTLWGVTVFGAEPRWPYPYEVIMVLLALLCLLALAGWWRIYRQILGATHFAQVTRPHLDPNKCVAPNSSNFWGRPIWPAFLLHFLLFVPIPLLRFTLSGRLNDSAQGRHLLIPAGSAMAMLLLAGWLAWVRPAWRERVALLASAVMLAWGVGHLGYLWWAYPPPLPVRTTPGPQLEVGHPLRLKFGDALELSGYQTKEANGVLQVDLLWQSLAQAWEDYRTELTLVDSQGQTQLRWLSQPAEGRFPVRAWQPGDQVRDTMFIPLAGTLPGDYTLNLRLLGWDQPLAAETVTLTKLNLASAPQAPFIGLWQRGKLANDAFPTYRYRATIPVTGGGLSSVALIAPDGRTFQPVAETNSLRLFTVDYDWPGGEYRLEVGGQPTPLTLKVDNFSWNFTPPAEMMYLVGANFADQIELLGYDLPTQRVQAGEGVPLVLYWRGLKQMRQDYTMFVQLLDADLQRRGGYDRFPRENYNTYLWVPGEVVDDGLAVPVEANAPDGVYTIRVGWYYQQNRQAESLPLVQNGQTLSETSVVIGPLKVGGAPPGLTIAEFRPQQSLKVNFGEVIGLRGYDLNRDAESLQVTLYWAGLKAVDKNYTVFVHLRDEAGQTITQADHPPAGGQYPTSLWDAGEIISDRFSVPLPPELKPGRYQIILGLYDPHSGVRLPFPDTADNSLRLTEINLP